MNTSYTNQRSNLPFRCTMKTAAANVYAPATATTSLNLTSRPPLPIAKSPNQGHSNTEEEPEVAEAEENLYELDQNFVNLLNQGDGEYVVSMKNMLDERPIQRLTVIEHFHRLMKEMLGEKLYASLLKKGVLSKNLPDEVITRKIMDALELKNKLLFSSTDPTISALDKLSFIQAAGSFRGALRAALSASANVKEACLEEAATEEVTEYEGLFLKHDKPKPEIRVLGYVGVTNSN